MSVLNFALPFISINHSHLKGNSNAQASCMPKGGGVNPHSTTISRNTHLEHFPSRFDVLSASCGYLS